jgi:hypothetical protein
MAEHDPSEDQHGSPSLWSAFGCQAARIALVTKLPMDSSVAAPLLPSRVAVLKACGSGNCAEPSAL